MSHPNRPDNSEPVEIEVDIEHTTDRAYLVTDGKNKGWVPKSQVTEFEPQFDGKGKLIAAKMCIPEWLAHERGFI